MQFVSPIDKCRAVSRVSRLWFYALFCSQRSWAAPFYVEGKTTNRSVPASLIPLMQPMTQLSCRSKETRLILPSAFFAAHFPHLTQLLCQSFENVDEHELLHFLQLNGSSLEQIVDARLTAEFNKPDSSFDFISLCPNLKCFPNGISELPDGEDLLRHWVALPRYSAFPDLTLEFYDDPGHYLKAVIDEWKNPSAPPPASGMRQLKKLTISLLPRAVRGFVVALPLLESFLSGLSASSLSDFSVKCEDGVPFVTATLPATFLCSLFRIFPRLRLFKLAWSITC